MQPTRHRAASTAAFALSTAAAPPAFGAAHADGPVRDGGGSVAFRGDRLPGLTCASTPSASSLTVPADSSLRVVNDNGHRATVLLDGATTGETAKGASADVLSRRGPVSLAPKPGCVFADQSSVRVDVAAPTVHQPAPLAANPAASPRAGSTTSGSGTSGGTAGGAGTRTNGSSGTATGRGAAGAAPTNAAQRDPAQAGAAETSAVSGDGTGVTAAERPRRSSDGAKPGVRAFSP